MKEMFTVLSSTLIIDGKKDLLIKAGVILSIIFIVISFGYNDTIIINRQTMSFIGTMFDEKGYGLLRYYDYAHDITELQRGKGLLAVDSMYDVPVFVIESMWLWPLYLLSKIMPSDVAATWYGILWGKLLYLLALLISAELMGRIFLFVFPQSEKVKGLILGYLASIITISSVYMVGQCDVIIICFILASVLAYLKRDKMYVFYSALAISMKPFALFPFLIMVLLREKNIYKIIVKIVAGTSVMLFCKLLFYNQSSITRAVRTEFFIKELRNMLINKIPIMYGKVPVIVLGIIICLVLAYMLRETFENLIGLCFLNFVLFFSSFIATPYWFLYIMPFLCIALEIIDDKRALFLSVVGNIFLFLSHMLRFHWVYDINIINRSLLGRMLGRVSVGEHALTLSNISKHYDVSVLVGCLHAVFLACIAGVILLYFLPNIQSESVMIEKGIPMKYRLWMAGGQITVAFLPVSIWFFYLLVSRLG